MGRNSKIGWCSHTANLYWGCSEVHAGCDHCYARVFSRAKGKAAAWQGSRFEVKSVWKNLAAWDAAATKAGEVHRVFCGSMMDIFEKPMPAVSWQGEPLDITTGDLRDRYFQGVIPATRNLLHLLLTKRPGNIPKYVPPEWLDRWPENVMTGTSVVDQETAETLIPQLIRSPGRHFLSVEPLLGPIDFSEWFFPYGQTGDSHVHDSLTDLPTDRIHWVIVGCESGPKARPMDEDWVRPIRDQCVAAGIPFFYKQKLEGRNLIEGPELDGKVWEEFPEPMETANR